MLAEPTQQVMGLDNKALHTQVSAHQLNVAAQQYINATWWKTLPNPAPAYLAI